MDGETTLYLLWHDPAADPPAGFDLHGDAQPLAAGVTGWLKGASG